MSSSPVTQERIEAVLDSFNLQHFRGDSDGMTRTAFPDLVCFFQVEEVGFKITTRWAPTVFSEERTQALRLTANGLNRSLPLLRVHPVEVESGGTVALIEAPFFTSGSVDDDQLKQMIQFYFSFVHLVKNQLEKEVKL